MSRPAQITSASFVLAVPDARRSGDWWSATFGFDAVFATEGFCFVRSGAATLRFGSCPDALHRHLVARAVDVISPPTDQPWGCARWGSERRTATASCLPMILPSAGGLAPAFPAVFYRAEGSRMPQDTRVDAYIAAAPVFARPILDHLRRLVHTAAPGLVEAIKWRMPMFLYRDKIVANMAAFTAHAAFGTWQRDATVAEPPPGGMGRLGKLTSLADLPPDDAIVAMVREAIAQVDAGGSLHARRAAKPAPVTPDDLAAALAASPVAAARFSAFPPGCRREYIGWIADAKTAPTRAKRIATTVEWSAAGKRRS